LLFHLSKNLEVVASSLWYTLGLGVEHSVVKQLKNKFLDLTRVFLYVEFTV